MARRGVKGIAFCIIAVLTATLMLAGCQSEGGGNPSASPSPAGKQEYTVTYQCEEGGWLTGTAIQTVAKGGSTMIVTAWANKGYKFKGWSDGVTKAERNEQDVNADIAVTAQFEEIIKARVTITYVCYGNGHIEGLDKQTVISGLDAETVTAVPDENYYFYGWSDGLKSPTRQDKQLVKDETINAFFAIIQYNVYYHTGEGGTIKYNYDQHVESGEYSSKVTALPDDEHDFLAWSDGVTTPTRSDLIKSDFEVTALFTRKKYDVVFKANTGGKVTGKTEQTILYGSDAEEVTATAEAGYEFTGWSDGVMTPTRKDTYVNHHYEARANFAIHGAPTYKILLVIATRLKAELKSNAGGTIQVDYTISDAERKIVEIVPKLVTGWMNDVFDSKVKFVVDLYYTTEMLGRENLIFAGSVDNHSYELFANMIPEVTELVEEYNTVMTTYCLNDFKGNLLAGAGTGGAKYGNVYLESLIRSRVLEGHPIESLYDFKDPYTYFSWHRHLELYMHEITHTIESLAKVTTGLHYVRKRYAEMGIYDELEYLRPFLLNQAVVDGKTVGIPETFWESSVIE